MEIQNTIIEPGESAVVRIPAGRLPSGNQIQIKAHIFRSDAEGPCVLVLAGVHGDEVNGVEILRRALAQEMFGQLRCGSVIAIPILNVYSFNNFSRQVPDGKDVNRSFPGSRNGSLASRVARTLSKKVLPLIDFGVDFHTGGRNHFNYPQIRYSPGDDLARQLARQFSAPYTLAKKPIARSLRKVAGEMNKAILIYEGGENQRLDEFSIEEGLAGLRRLLHARGLLEHSKDAAARMGELQHTTWVRASRAGIFQAGRLAGHAVLKGEVIGLISDPYGDDSLPVRAPRDGHLLGHTNAPLISQGDALFHLGY